MSANVDTLSDYWWPSARRETPHNEFALISFCCALVLPLAFCRALFARFAAPTDTLETTLGVLLSIACAPAAVVAVVTGHRALVRAQRLPLARARRRLAWSGLVGGYLCMALIFGIRVLPTLVAEGQPARASVHPSSTRDILPSPAIPALRVVAHLPRRAPVADQGGRTTPTCATALSVSRCWRAGSLATRDGGASLHLMYFHATSASVSLTQAAKVRAASPQPGAD